MFNNLVMFKGTKKVDHILESSTDFQFFFEALIIYQLSIIKKRYSSRLKIPMFIGTPCFLRYS